MFKRTVEQYFTRNFHFKHLAKPTSPQRNDFCLIYFARNLTPGCKQSVDKGTRYLLPELTLRKVFPVSLGPNSMSLLLVCGYPKLHLHIHDFFPGFLYPFWWFVLSRLSDARLDAYHPGVCTLLVKNSLTPGVNICPTLFSSDLRRVDRLVEVKGRIPLGGTEDA